MFIWYPNRSSEPPAKKTEAANGAAADVDSDDDNSDDEKVTINDVHRTEIHQCYSVFLHQLAPVKVPSKPVVFAD